MRQFATFPGWSPARGGDRSWRHVLAVASVVLGTCPTGVAVGDTAAQSSAAAAAPASPGPAPQGPLLVDQILRRYDLNGDGNVDEIEASIGQAKIRRHRSQQRAESSIDPVTSRPRSQSDPTAPLGFHPGGTTAAETPSPPAAPLTGSAGSSRSEPAGTSASADRQRRIMEVIDPRRGRTTDPDPRGGTGAEAAQRGASTTPAPTTPQPFGWIPGGDGTVFRGGSYPLPDRSRSSASRRGGGAGPLLSGSPGAAPRGGVPSQARPGSGTGSTRYTTPPSSRATVPQPSRGGGKTSGSSAAPSGSGAGGRAGNGSGGR
ncbi:MAG: hypothetical protein FJ309_05805 [Planctomycetes bacterium]|nr:hypothetical protein [Planctomycetota bacterium]